MYSIVENLRQTVEYCREHSEFYRKVYKNQESASFSSIEEFEKLPFTGKNDLKRFYPYGFMSCSLEQVTGYYETTGDKADLNRSSRCSSLFTREDLERDLNRRSSGPLEFGSRDVVFNSLSYAYSCAAMSFHNAALRQGAMVVSADNDSRLSNYRKQVDILTRINPTVIITAYPFVISTILHIMGESTEKLTNLRAIQLSGMPHSPNGMKKISQVFNGVPVYNTYDLVEFGAVSTVSTDGANRIFDDFYVEVINPKTMEVIKEDGIGGEIVITSLNRQGSPLIRYKTGDIGRLYRNCNTPYLQVLGRFKDLVEFKEINRRFTLYNFEDVFYRHEAVKGMYKPRFNGDKLTFAIDTDADNKEEVSKEIQNMIKNELEIDVEIEAVNTGISRREFLLDSGSDSIKSLQTIENKKNEWLITY